VPAAIRALQQEPLFPAATPAMPSRRRQCQRQAAAKGSACPPFHHHVPAWHAGQSECTLNHARHRGRQRTPARRYIRRGPRGACRSGGTSRPAENAGAQVPPARQRNAPAGTPRPMKAPRSACEGRNKPGTPLRGKVVPRSNGRYAPASPGRNRPAENSSMHSGRQPAASLSGSRICRACRRQHAQPRAGEAATRSAVQGSRCSARAACCP